MFSPFRTKYAKIGFWVAFNRECLKILAHFYTCKKRYLRKYKLEPVCFESEQCFFGGEEGGESKPIWLLVESVSLTHKYMVLWAKIIGAKPECHAFYCLLVLGLFCVMCCHAPTVSPAPPTHLLTSPAAWNTMSFWCHWDLGMLKLSSDLEYAVLQVLLIKSRLWIWGLNQRSECKTTHMQSGGGNLCFWSETLIRNTQDCQPVNCYY